MGTRTHSSTPWLFIQPEVEAKEKERAKCLKNLPNNWTVRNNYAILYVFLLLNKQQRRRKKTEKEENQNPKNWRKKMKINSGHVMYLYFGAPLPISPRLRWWGCCNELVAPPPHPELLLTSLTAQWVGRLYEVLIFLIMEQVLVVCWYLGIALYEWMRLKWIHK